MQKETVQIVKILSEHKKRNGHANIKWERPASGSRRVMAAVKFPGSKQIVTRHCDTQDGKTGVAIF